MYKIVLNSRAKKDAILIERANLKNKVAKLIQIIRINPFQNPPQYEKLRGDFTGSYSCRINEQHRLIYQVYEEENTIKIIRMWKNYE